jgi:hypothetical protein
MALVHPRKLNRDGEGLRMWPVLAATVGLALTSCDAPVDNSAAPRSVEPTKAPIMIRTAAGLPKEQAFLVEPTRDLPFDQLADGVRETGNRCDAVTSFKQLEDNGERMDVYKLDCGSRAYQVTVLKDSTHIKRWTGNIIGE